MVKNENIILQSGWKENFIFNKFFWLLSQILDFTLYSKSTVVEYSQKANFIGFKQGQFWIPYMCTFHLAYFKSGCQFMTHEGQTPPGPNRVLDTPLNRITRYCNLWFRLTFSLQNVILGRDFAEKPPQWNAEEWRKIPIFEICRRKFR